MTSENSVLISVPALAARLAEQPPPVLADVRWNLTGPPGRPEYEAGHLPGAQWVDLETELSGPLRPGRTGGRHPLPDPEVFATAMRRIGVTADGEVVVYDGASSLAAARLWWLLLDAGFARVRVLDGGFAAWQRAGLPVQTGPGEPVRPGDFRGRPGQLPRLDAAAVLDLVGDAASGTSLVDVRAPERYAGRSEPLDPVAGHIPTALNRPSTGNLNPDGSFRPPAEIAQRFSGLSDPVLYCGSGITAAHSLLALSTAGLGGRIYPGSWSDWVSDPARPVATGQE
ncbi:MAG: Thiosulfate sulfurtransferase, rhodanese [uncultured Friedmanniella sp.]|uniref:Thiosulfate sulfurtransferase, rhodanese n=1 Tax=uncultured Friedmanniella sp. TaxID=335381 RepID=A0A6J4L5H5_9ACTN|nr:sulfurtransferase [uncultured Friedmanniella sp.]CAA9321875.1 MAG: Thiosulfate sulfurtransferase, rhodanese [uncultured Friedmanniella sp.]